MSENPLHPQRVSAHKAASGHGTFKHMTKGTTLKTVLRDYGLSQSDFKRVRELVASKETAHAR